MKSVIIISPHPDDLEIGMGGTVAKLLSAGYDLVSLVVTDGRRSTDTDTLGEQQLADLREREVTASSNILGIKTLELLRMDNVETEDSRSFLRDSFNSILEKYKPAEIYIPHPEIDKHRTHRTVSSLVLEVLRRVTSRGTMPVCWCYEVWTPFEWYDRIEDISEFVDIKKQSIEQHRSQTSYKNYTDGILGLNRYRAVFNEISGHSDMKYAEIFIRYEY